MVLIKQYDTPFERLCLEERPEFSDPKSQKLIQSLYNRSGYLKVGDSFVKIEEIEGLGGFTKTIYGRVTGIDKYEVTGVHYIKDDIKITVDIDEPDEPKEHILRAEESAIKKAALLNKTLFNQKEYIDCEYNRAALENIIWKMNGNQMINDKEYFEVSAYDEIWNIKESKVLAYIEENRAYLESLITDENGKKHKNMSIDIVGAWELDNFVFQYDLIYGYKSIEMPETEYYLFVYII